MQKVRTIVEYAVPTDRVDVSTKDLEQGFEKIVKATVDDKAVLRISSKESEFHEVEGELKCPKCGSKEFELHTKLESVDTLLFEDGKWVVRLDGVNESPSCWTFTDVDEVYCANCGVEIPKEKLETIEAVEYKYGCSD